MYIFLIVTLYGSGGVCSKSSKTEIFIAIPIQVLKSKLVSCSCHLREKTVVAHFCISGLVNSSLPGRRFKNTYVFFNLRALKISTLYKNFIFHCMHKIFWGEFQRYPLKFHTKYLIHSQHWKMCILCTGENLRALRFTPPTKSLWTVLPPVDSTLTLRLFQQVAVRKPLYVNHPNKFCFKGQILYC